MTSLAAPANVSPVDGTSADEQPCALRLALPLVASDAPLPDANLIRRGLLAQLETLGHDVPEALHGDPGPGGHPWTISSAIRWRRGWWAAITAVGTRTLGWLGDALRPGRLEGASGWALGPYPEWRGTALSRGDLDARIGGDTLEVGVGLLSPTVLSGPRGAPPALTAGALLASWRTRWQHHVGAAPGPADDRAFTALVRDHVHLISVGIHDAPWRSTRAGVGGRGARGWLILATSDSPEAVEVLGRLARFAECCGTGRHTALGLGRTVLGGPDVDDESNLRRLSPINLREATGPRARCSARAKRRLASAVVTAFQDPVTTYRAEVARARKSACTQIRQRIAELEAGPVAEWRRLQEALEGLDAETRADTPAAHNTATVSAQTRKKSPAAQKRPRRPAATARATRTSNADRREQLVALATKQPGVTGKAAAAALGISMSYVSMLARELRTEGRLGPGPGLRPPV